jgi:hypothetical protein
MKRSLLHRMRRVERHVGSARLEDAEGGDDHRGRPRKAQRHAALAARPERTQAVGELIGTPLELAVAEHGVRRGNRGRVLGFPLARRPRTAHALAPRQGPSRPPVLRRQR